MFVDMYFLLYDYHFSYRFSGDNGDLINYFQLDSFNVFYECI